MPTAIGTVKAVTADDPRLVRNTPALSWAPTREGIQILDARAGGTVWVEARTRPPKFTTTPWDAEEDDYAAGDVVYYSTTRECYQALVDNPTTGQAPTADTAQWLKLDMPYVIAQAVQQFAYADGLEDDGQHEKAAAQREKAEERLGTEWGKINQQQGQVRRSMVLTR